MFDQMMIYAIMIITFCHFLAEQKSLERYSFIPLRNWHKLVNIFLLIEQCSLVLYLGNIQKDIENTLFGINLVLILVLQEKDEVKGEIKYSILPLVLNNTYMFLSNINTYFSSNTSNQVPDGQSALIPSASPSSSPLTTNSDHVRALDVVKNGSRQSNKEKVFYGMIYYMGSLIGYYYMMQRNQGL